MPRIDCRTVLYAIGSQKAEKALSDLIAGTNETNMERGAEPVITYNVIGTVTSQSALKEYLPSHQLPSILIYSEGLDADAKPGSEDAFDFILGLHHDYPTIRIIFLAGDRRVGDTSLAALVAYHIYDFLTGSITIPDILRRVVEPNTYDSVRRYLPGMGARIFEGGNRDVSLYAASAEAVKQREAERMAEQAAYETKIAEISSELERKRQEAEALKVSVSAYEAKVKSVQTQAASALSLEQTRAAERYRVLEASRSELEGKYTTAVNERASLLTRLTAAKTDNGRLTEENRALRDNLNKAGAELERCRDYDEAVYRNKSLGADLEAATQKCGRLQARLDESDSALAQTAERLRVTDEALASTASELETLKSESSRAIENQAERLDAAKTREDELAAARLNAEREVRRLTAELAFCSGQLADRKAEAETRGIKYEADRQTMGASLAAAQAERDELRKSLDRAREDLRAATDQREQLRQALADANTRLDGSAHQALIADLTIKKQALADEIANLTAVRDETVRMQRIEIEARTKKLRMQLAAATGDTADAMAAREAAEASCREAKGRAEAEAKAAREAAEAEIRAVKEAAAEEIRAAREKADAEIGEARAKAAADVQAAKDMAAADAIAAQEAAKADTKERIARLREDVRAQEEAAKEAADDFVRKLAERAAELERLDAEIAEKTKQRATISDTVSGEIEAERGKYRADMEEISHAVESARAEGDRIRKANEELRAETETLRTAAESAREEKERLDSDIKSVREASDRVIDEERDRADAEVARVRRESDAQLTRIARAFNAEKSRLSADYKRHQEEIRIRERAEGVLNGYRYNADSFVNDANRYRNPVITMFYSRTAGCGTTSVALNTATYLASSGKKTLFLSFGWINPVFKESLGCDFFRPCLYNAVEGMVMEDFSGLERAVITKQALYNGDETMRPYYNRYPDLLHFAAYADASVKALPPTPDIIKGMLAYYAKKKNYERIIVDLPSYADPNLVETVRVLCSRHVIVMAHDTVSMNHTGDFFTLARSGRMDSKAVRAAMTREPIVVCSRYVPNTPLTCQRIAQFCGVQTVCAVTDKPLEFILAANRFSPVVLVSRDEEYFRCIQGIGNYVNGTNG